ncbi:phage antirepressor KilAC domain-containing protein [Microbacterium sp. 22195]|uniref:phage antirepressor KilAC domain-containing protein n=1 Tax=Microbacterium sp. 22195 TaxID=3453891 RepID=UPI003F8746FF
MNSLALSAELDDLKIITLTDGEIWSARDLMPFAGYTDWRNWSQAINRAIASVNASGLNAADHFVGSTKMIQIGKGARREVEDVQLTRYAAYVLFQNADGSKPEIAALQQYFAVQTRKQEVAAAPKGAELLALAVIEAQQMLADRDQHIAELTPRAEAWDDLASAEGDYAVADAANILKRAGISTGPQRLFDTLGELGWIYRGEERRWRPYARALDAGYLTERAMPPRVKDGELLPVAPQVRVTARGLERLRVRLGGAA